MGFYMLQNAMALDQNREKAVDQNISAPKKTSLSEGEMSVQTERSKEVIFIQPVIIGMIFCVCAR